MEQIPPTALTAPASARLKDPSTSWTNSNLQNDYELRSIQKFEPHHHDDDDDDDDVEHGSSSAPSSTMKTIHTTTSDFKFGLGFETGREEGPPPLHVPTKTRNLLFNIGVMIAVLDLAVLPVVYFYALSFGTGLKRQTVFIVITCLFCLMTFAHFTHRCIRLVLKCSERYGPIGWRRKWRLLEFTNLHFALCASIFEIVLLIGTFPSETLIRVCALPPTIIVLYLSFLFLSTSLLTHFKTPLPFPMSSTPKGALFRPALLAILEDSAAIEYRGEREGRTAVLRRYESSVLFRRLTQRLSWGWGGAFLGLGVLGIGCCFGIEEEAVAFGVGWGVPFAGAAVLGLPTVWFVKRSLREERRLWRGDWGDMGVK